MTKSIKLVVMSFTRLVRVSLLQWRKIILFFSQEKESEAELKDEWKKRAGDSEEIGTIVSVE